MEEVSIWTVKLELDYYMDTMWVSSILEKVIKYFKPQKKNVTRFREDFFKHDCCSYLYPVIVIGF